MEETAWITTGSVSTDGPAAGRAEEGNSAVAVALLDRFDLLFPLSGAFIFACDKRRDIFLLLSLDSSLSERLRRYSADVNTAAF